MSYQGGMYTGVFHNLFRKPVNAQSEKEYKTKIDTLKGIDGKLDRELETLKKLMMDHSKKLTSVDNFVIFNVSGSIAFRLVFSIRFTIG